VAGGGRVASLTSTVAGGTGASAATGTLLCSPSLGADYNTDKFAPKCGTGGARSRSTVVCEGDQLRIRFTVANYSTSTVQVLAWVFFSADTTLSDTDVPAASTSSLWIHPGGSKIVTASAKVPDLTSLTGLAVKPILRVTSWEDLDGDGVSEGNTTYTDWTPLQGWLSVC
jgi:hypothetical protein